MREGRSRSPARRERGFTLIELMTVVALVAILATLALGIGKNEGNPRSGATQIASALGLARARAIATRKIHRVQIEPTTVSIWQATTTGFRAPTAYDQVQATGLGPAVIAANGSTTIQVAAGASVTVNGSLVFSIDFKPDGSSTGGTVFVTGSSRDDPYRVVVYRATGSSYVREGW